MIKENIRTLKSEPKSLRIAFVKFYKRGGQGFDDCPSERIVCVNCRHNKLLKTRGRALKVLRGHAWETQGNPRPLFFYYTIYFEKKIAFKAKKSSLNERM